MCACPTDDDASVGPDEEDAGNMIIEDTDPPRQESDRIVPMEVDEPRDATRDALAGIYLWRFSAQHAAIGNALS